MAVPVVAVVDPDVLWRTRLTKAVSPRETDEHGTLDSALAAAPAALIVGPGVADELLDRLGEVRAVRPDLLVVVVAEHLSVPALQAGMRAGVFDMVAADDESRVLDRSLQAAVAALDADPDHTTELNASCAPGRLIVVTGPKSGEGCTTIAVNLARLLAQRTPGRVTLVEGDARFGDLAVALSLPAPELADPGGFAALAVGRVDVEDHLHEFDGVHVLVTPRSYARISPDVDEHAVEIISAAQVVSDVVVVDAPFPLVEEADLLTYADRVLLVSDMDLTSLKNVLVARQILSYRGVVSEKLQLVVNRVRPGHDVEEAARVVGLELAAHLPDTDALHDDRGVPLLDDADDEFAASLATLADDLLV